MNVIFSIAILFCGVSHFLCATEGVQVQKSPPFSFEVRQQDHMLSTILDITSDHVYLGSIVKNHLRIRISYELLGPKGEYEGMGFCRYLTLGGGRWSAQIELLDPKKEIVGLIKGEVIPNGSVRFFLYNEEERCVGIADLDELKSKFTIVNPEDEQQLLATLKRNYVRGIVDYWNVTIHKIDEIDLRLIKVFVAFAIDSQDEF